MAHWRRLIDLLETQGIPYQTHVSERDEADPGTDRLSGRCVATVVIASPEQRAALLVTRADREIDLSAVGRALRHPEVRLASDDELGQLFPDCELGAMPPFGNWYGIPVFLDEQLAQEQEVTFYAGSRARSITLPMAALELFSNARRVFLGAPGRSTTDSELGEVA
ncbi:MAG: YbaK/EbsC family protein [Chloroflexi bacterium]|nr:YbaK/EbsC family protein [Chloroflexota bacterium]